MIWKPVDVPRGFVPRHRFSTPLPPTIIHRAKAALQRALVLGEKPITGQITSSKSITKNTESNDTRIESQRIKLASHQSFQNSAASAAMASRFTPAVKLDVSNVGEGGLMSGAKLKAEAIASKKKSLKDVFVSHSSDNHTIREQIRDHRCKPSRCSENWIPNSLLFKRFNIRNPYKGKSGGEDNTIPVTQSSMAEFKKTIQKSFGVSSEGSLEAGEAMLEAKAALSSVKEVSAHDPAVDTTDKPSVDLFKSIFEDDSSDEEINEEKLKEEIETGEILVIIMI